MLFNYVHEGDGGQAYGFLQRQPFRPSLFDREAVDTEIYYKGGVDYLLGKKSPKTTPEEPLALPLSLPDGANTLDRLATGSADSFVTGLLSDKTKFAGLAARGLGGLIEERYRIRDKNLALIDYDICHGITLLYELLPWAQLGGFEKQRQTLDIVLFGLEREKRMEDVSCWRDVSRVHQDFVTALAEYSAASRREGLFSGKSYLDR